MLSQEEPVPIINQRLSARPTKSPATLTYNEDFEQDNQIPSAITMDKDDDGDDMMMRPVSPYPTTKKEQITELNGIGEPTISMLAVPVWNCQNVPPS